MMDRSVLINALKRLTDCCPCMADARGHAKEWEKSQVNAYNELIYRDL